MNGLLARNDLIEDPILRFEQCSIPLFIGIVVTLFAVGVMSGSKWQARAAVSALAASGVALSIAHFLSVATDRARPFVAHAGSVHNFANHVADAGFPSDHSSAAFAIGTAIFLRNRRFGAGVLGLAALLAAGRVAIGVHYPSDVITGALFGVLAALLLWIAPIRRSLDRIADLFLRRPQPVKTANKGLAV